MPAVIVPDLTEVARQQPAGWFLHGQCRLVYVDAVTVQLQPYQGNFLWIDGHPRLIPDAGVTLPGGLLSDTTYLVAAYMEGEVIALQAIQQAVGHRSSPGLGIEVLADNPRASLVGMVRLVADQFTESGVLSWHHRRTQTTGRVFTVARSTGVVYPSWVEVHAEIGFTFLTWTDEPVRLTIMASHHNVTTASGVMTGIAVDGTLVALAATGNSGGTDILFSAFVTNTQTHLAEGAHYATLAGAATTGGTATWLGLQSGVPAVSLNVEFHG